VAVRVGEHNPTAVDPENPVPNPPQATYEAGPALRLERCVGAASWFLSANSVAGLVIDRSLLCCRTGGLDVDTLYNARIEASDILAGVSLAMLANWTAQDLLVKADTLAAELASASTLVLINSIALRFNNFRLGWIRDSFLTAGVGLALVNGEQLSLKGNTWIASLRGMYIVKSSGGIELNGESIRRPYDDKVPRGYSGVEFLTEGPLSLTDTRIWGFQVGIRIGGSYAGNMPRFFTDLQIRNNQISFADVGIQVGTEDGSLYPGLIGSFAITENNVTARSGGILVNARASAGSAKEGIAVPIRVADNMVVAALGIGILGNHVEVADNLVQLPASLSQGNRFGIVLVYSLNVSCERNQIELRSFNFPSFEWNFEAEEFYLGAYLAATKRMESAAILLAGGSDSKVAGNSTQAEKDLAIRSIIADTHERLTLCDNDFLSGSVDCTKCNDIVCQSNTLSGDLEITDTIHGTVRHNRVRHNRAEDSNASLYLGGITGNWHVIGNHIDGGAMIRPPRMLPIIPFDEAGVTLNFLENFKGALRPTTVDTLSVIERLAGNQDFTASLYSFEPEPDPRPDRLAPRFATEAGGAAYAITHGDWVERYQAAIREFILASADISLAEKANEAITKIRITWLREGRYSLLCSGNKAAELTIGWSEDSAWPDQESVVQVIGNQVSSNVSVNSYSKLVLALNAAGQYPLAGNSINAPIIAPNLNFI
jgi:hypothetical protein